MKITDVEAIELRLPESEIEDKASAAQDALIIKIHTEILPPAHLPAIGGRLQ